MNRTTKSLLWIGEITAGVLAGVALVKNRDKFSSENEKMTKWLSDLKKTLEDKSRKMMDSGSKAIQNGTKAFQKA